MSYLAMAEENSQLNSPKHNIFSKRINIKPYEYPELLKYVEAIRHSYWVHTEFNYDPDIQDMKVNMKQHEREALKRAMLAISQVENAVKTFWGNIYTHLPKPEIAKVGATFAECEVRHEDAYAELLEKLGLNNEFENIKNIPAMHDRIAYIQKISAKTKDSTDPKDYFKSIIFFSMLIENVSLFSQFYIIMAFNKFDNVLKGMSNAVEATSKEEDQHANFGFDLINIIKEENPEWWTEELQDYIVSKCRKAYLAEMKVLDWIYEHGDLEAAPRATVNAFIAYRINTSLKAIGIKNMGILWDKSEQTNFEWFEDEVTVTKNNDFFQKRSTNYTKHSKAITEEDLF